MTQPKWITREIADTFHVEVVDRFGGAQGIRDEGLIEGALASPQNRFAYGGDVSIFELAASLCRSIVKEHAFVDGNKRSGLVAAVAFLSLNGFELAPEEDEIAPMIEGLAASSVDEQTLAKWFEGNCQTAA